MKNVFLGILFLYTAVMVLQIDFPNPAELAKGFNQFFIREQISLSAKKDEPSLKEGWLYYNMGDYKAARKVMEQIARSEQDASALYCLSLMDIKEGKTEEGISKLEALHQKSPQHTPTIFALADAYYGERYYIQSMSLLEKLLEYEPANQQARLLLGKSYVKTGQKEAAARIFKTVSGETEAREAIALLRTLN